MDQPAAMAMASELKRQTKRVHKAYGFSGIGLRDFPATPHGGIRRTRAVGHFKMKPELHPMFLMCSFHYPYFWW